MNLLPKLPNAKLNQQRREAELYKSLMHYQGKLGGELFGPVPAGNRREFFCLDKHTWVWHEEWQESGQKHMLTTRYDVRPSGILKSQGGRHYQALTKDETRHLYTAIKLYVAKMNHELPKLAYA